MKVRLEDSNKISIRLKLIYVVIILICIISIIVSVVIQTNKEKQEEQKIPQISEEEIDSYKTQFDNIFENKVNYASNNSYKITKLKDNEQIVYTDYQKKENKINDYELDVNIPYINIDNETVEELNQKITDIFEKKAKNVLNTKDNNIIYTVNYSAYVTNNILSLVIKSTLKEGNNPQRDMVKTYNYDLANQKECTIQEMLDMKGITRKQANQNIKKEITSVQAKVEELEMLGYKIYSRDLESDIYNVNNVTEYFIDDNNAIYIIFAYGNENDTSEIDIVVM